MPVYKQDLLVYATAYAKADNAEEAAKKITELAKHAIDLKPQMASEIEISDEGYQSPYLPEVSLSPAMFIDGVVGEVEEAGN